jgi:hypothetical protein
MIPGSDFSVSLSLARTGGDVSKVMEKWLREEFDQSLSLGIMVQDERTASGFAGLHAVQSSLTFSLCDEVLGSRSFSEPVWI